MASAGPAKVCCSGPAGAQRRGRPTKSSALLCSRRPVEELRLPKPWSSAVDGSGDSRLGILASSPTLPKLAALGEHRLLSGGIAHGSLLLLALTPPKEGVRSRTCHPAAPSGLLLSAPANNSRGIAAVRPRGSSAEASAAAGRCSSAGAAGGGDASWPPEVRPVLAPLAAGRTRRCGGGPWTGGGSVATDSRGGVGLRLSAAPAVGVLRLSVAPAVGVELRLAALVSDDVGLRLSALALVDVELCLLGPGRARS